MSVYLKRLSATVNADDLYYAARGLFVVNDPANVAVPGRVPADTGFRLVLRKLLVGLSFPLIFLLANSAIPLCWLLSVPPLPRLLPEHPVHLCRGLMRRIIGHYCTVVHGLLSPVELHITLAQDMSPGELFERPDIPDTSAIRMPRRTVWMANHLLDSDYSYLWLLLHASEHKNALTLTGTSRYRRTPLLGRQFYAFLGCVFLERDWQRDQSAMTTRLQELSTGWESRAPLALVIFPEGYLLYKDQRESMRQYMMRANLPFEVPRYTLLPRVKGLYHILNQLRTADLPYLYDVTFAVEGVGPDDDPYDAYHFTTLLMLGIRPRAVHVHLRRWQVNGTAAAAAVPLAGGEAVFACWLMDRWREKEQMLARFHATGSLVADRPAGTFVRRIRPRWSLDELWPHLLLIAVYVGIGWLLQYIISRTFSTTLHTT